MAVTVSIEIYEDTDGLYRWSFLDTNGKLHGPSVAFDSRWRARADIDKLIATNMNKQEYRPGSKTPDA